MTARTLTRLTFALAALAVGTASARADLQICSRMSYVVEVAVAIEDKGTAATRGWYRIDPGQCRTVIQGTLRNRTALHPRPRAAGVRRLAAAAGRAMPISASARNSFTLAAAQTCTRSGFRMARFTAVKPSQTDKGMTAYLAEDAEYTDEQARDAAIQRLLVIAGYDANPIDGIRGEKTDTAIARFIADNRLENTAAGRADFLDMLMAAAQKPYGAGFAWCNETRNMVMAALGFEDQGNVVTRGWYRVAPGQMPAAGPHRQAAAALQLRRGGRAGQPAAPRRRSPAGQAGPPATRCLPPCPGAVRPSCARATSKFELSDHRDCGGSGLTATGFATVEMSGTGATTVQFK